MSKIPTAAELAEEMFIKDKGSYSSFNRVGFTGLQLTKVAIEFAKLHVEEALKAASKVELTDCVDYQSGDISYYQNETGILNAYPLTNIK